jgi:SAM-dependent methyltransferase
LTYDYSKYWKKAGKKYKKNFRYTDAFTVQEYKLLAELKKLDFKSVFELGCGFGRITKIIMNNFDVSRYDAVDISKHQIKNADVPGVNFEVADFMEYTPKGTYDLVLASEVLLHIPPNLIKQTVSKLLSMSKKYLVTIDAYGKYEKLADHNFIHPYLELYSNHTVEPIDLNNGQYLFVVRI